MVCRPRREEPKKGRGTPPSPISVFPDLLAPFVQEPLLPPFRDRRNQQKKAKAQLCPASHPLICVPGRVRIWREGQSDWGISGPRLPPPPTQLRLQSLLFVAEREQRDGQ